MADIRLSNGSYLSEAINTDDIAYLPNVFEELSSFLDKVDDLIVGYEEARSLVFELNQELEEVIRENEELTDEIDNLKREIEKITMEVESLVSRS